MRVHPFVMLDILQRHHHYHQSNGFIYPRKKAHPTCACLEIDKLIKRHCLQILNDLLSII